MENIVGGITAPLGFESAGIAAGIKKSAKKDLALIYSTSTANAAALFTTNQVQAAPVVLSKERLKNEKAQAIIINSGNANACTGEQGQKDAEKMTELVAKSLQIDVNKVLVASTGIIGEYLPITKIADSISDLRKSLGKNSAETAEAILTTDTCLKQIALSFNLGGKKVTIGGIAKGSGMIHPNMATMLAFITTDCAIGTEFLKEALSEANDLSFNKISVDGDQSTNDSVFVLANGQANNEIINKKDDKFLLFLEALKKICIYLAKAIVLDGEGASKFITIKVKGATDDGEAEKIARKVANSTLVKTACFGNDPNWGRILAAIGSCGVQFNLKDLVVKINGVTLFANALPVKTKEKLNNLMEKRKILITIDLKKAYGQTEFWTTDLSYDYVKINAEYHT